MTLDSKLKEIKERCELATEGPWHIEAIEDDIIISRGIFDSHKQGLNKGEDYELFDEADAQFIARSRTDIPMLLEMVEFLKEELDQLGMTHAPEFLEKIAEKYK